MHQGPEPAMTVVGILALLIWLVFVLGMVALSLVCTWKISAKAGYSGAMGLLILIPGVGMLVWILIMAFGKWPILQSAAPAPAYPASTPPQ